MVLCEDGECSVCLLPYSRMDRIPRVLHCRHTFCDPCLETLSRFRSGLLTVPCPLCRQVTCIGLGLSLQEALWVNDKLWDQIPDIVDAGTSEGGEDGQEQKAEEERMAAKQQQPSSKAQCISSRIKLFFRRFSLMKQHQEMIIPGGNVEMKSWRKLSPDETF